MTKFITFFLKVISFNFIYNIETRYKSFNINTILRTDLLKSYDEKSQIIVVEELNYNLQIRKTREKK